jgi:hypothetical protein
MTGLKRFVGVDRSRVEFGTDDIERENFNTFMNIISMSLPIGEVDIIMEHCEYKCVRFKFSTHIKKTGVDFICGNYYNRFDQGFVVIGGMVMIEMIQDAIRDGGHKLINLAKKIFRDIDSEINRFITEEEHEGCKVRKMLVFD